MDTLIERIADFAGRLGINVCLEFAPELLVPEERIREYCYENKCGNYRNHYMCPPHIGPVEEMKARLGEYRRGVLLQYSQPLDVANDVNGVVQTMVDFHHRVLRMEDFLKDCGVTRLWGMIGGSCMLCEVCKAGAGEPCPYPDRARTSLESLAVDVVSLLSELKLDNKFHPDRITWTGCILFDSDLQEAGRDRYELRGKDAQNS